MLVLCCTPLQTLVASALLEARGIKRFKLIYYTWVDNEKHRFYFAGLANRAAASAFIHLNSRFPVHFVRFRAALKAVRAWEEQDIALASIDSFYVQYVVSQYGDGKLLTFDDGTTNINLHSAYHQNVKYSNAYRLVSRCLRGKVDPHWIRSRLSEHYTLYPEFENIVEGARLVPVTLSNRGAPADTGPLLTEGQEYVARERRIFLGQPVSDLAGGALVQVYPEIVAATRIDDYLPHPREIPLSGAFHVVHTWLIAEDYLLEQLARYERVSVFSISSAALLNLSHPRLRKTIITSAGISPTVASLYPQFEARGCCLMSMEQLCG